MEKKKNNNNMPKPPKPKYAGSIRKYYKAKKESDWYFLCGCGKKGINFYDYRPCIQCDVCKVWKHVKCVGFPKEISKLSNEMRKRRIWVCSDCKSGNFKFIAKMWLIEDSQQEALYPDNPNPISRSLSSLDDVTKSIAENENYERDLAVKKNERKKKLVRMPTAFDDEYTKLDPGFFDSIDSNNNNNGSKLKNSFNSVDLIQNDEDDKNNNNNVVMENKKKDKSKKSPKKKEKKMEKEEEETHSFKESEVMFIVEKRDNNDNKENERLVNSSEISITRIRFTEEIIQISDENTQRIPRHDDNNYLPLKSIMKEPTEKFDEGPSLPTPADFRHDPNNLVFKENSKERLARAGRNLIRTMAVY